MLTDIKAVIFDLDGTVIDSMWMWEAIDIEYLSRFDIPFEKSYQKDIEGMSFNETAVYFKNRFSLPDSLDVIKSDWNKMAYLKYKHEVQPKQGVVEFLQKLKAAGIKTGIGTSNSIELCRTILESKGLEQYFDAVHTSDEARAGKPAPDIYLLVAKSLGVKPSECIVFEDLYQGICAGKNAGMKTCAVADAYSEASWQLKCQTADYHINSFTDDIITAWRY